MRCSGTPEQLREEIVSGYRKLGDDVAVDVAVRSSATSEDTAGTSFAGMNGTFTNVVGPDQLVSRVIDCWASAMVSA